MSELCRDCQRVHYCATQDHQIELHSLICPVPNYQKIDFTREILFEIFSFRYFVSLCVQRKQDDAHWIAFCRDQYCEIYDTLIVKPEERCLEKVIELYEQLDLFCKDECGVNFFHFGKRSVETESGNDFFRRADDLILRDWTEYGHRVFVSISVAQAWRALKNNEGEE